MTSKNSIIGLSGVLTLELDENSIQKLESGIPPLSREDASSLAQSMANDLDAALGGIRNFGVCIPGCVYDQTELMKIDFPIFNTLQEIYINALDDDSFSANIISIGTSDNVFPIESLLPRTDIIPGPLALIPFTLIGPEDQISKLDEHFDQSLLDHGNLSGATLDHLNQFFGLAPVNASYISLASLCALQKTHLTTIGCEPLWDILEHAFFNTDTPNLTRLENGNAFLYSSGCIYVPYFTFDQWAEKFPQLENEQLIEGYIDWIRTYRQYIAGLDAHGLIIFQFMHKEAFDADSIQSIINQIGSLEPFLDHYLAENTISTDSSPNRIKIIEHFHNDVGSIAYTYTELDDNGIVNQINYYPLSLDGISQLEQLFEEQKEDCGLDFSFERSETIIFDNNTRKLTI